MTVGIEKYEVSADKLRWQCDPGMFNFDCTKDLAPLREFVGQDRAIRAIEFGLSMEQDGYNIYVAGLTGTGKTSAVKRQIDKLLEEEIKFIFDFSCNCIACFLGQIRNVFFEWA
jgi:Cdc6-like AAA superfamily ATPase